MRSKSLGVWVYVESLKSSLVTFLQKRKKLEKVLLPFLCTACHCYVNVNSKCETE